MGINALEDSGVWTGMEDAIAVEIREEGRRVWRAELSPGCANAIAT